MVRKLNTTFGKISKLYDSARPSYPAKLIKDIIKISKIKQNQKILDVGCGPATCTKLFASKGYTLLGIDVTKSIISHAQKITKDFLKTKYKVGGFEDINLKLDKFDLIYSAQAWHWVDSNIGYKKAHDLLNKDGHLALFWKYEEIKKSKFIQKVQKIFKKYHVRNKKSSIKRAEVELKQNKSLFYPYTKKEYVVYVDFDKKRYYDMIHTFSWIVELPPKIKKEFESDLNKLLNKQPEKFKIPYKYTLLIAKKK